MYATDFTQVGANIKSYLYDKGLTEQNLADALGISKHEMNKIIKGSKVINVNEIARIASTIGSTTDELLIMPELIDTMDILSSMCEVMDDVTLEKVNIIRMAIGEIHKLEELLYA